MISGLRRKAGEYILARRLKQNKRAVRAIPLSEVQSVLLLVSIDKPESFQACLEYEKFLKKEEGVRNVELFGYTDRKELPADLIANENHYFLTKKDLNWFYSPINKEIIKVLKSKHQLLIDTSFEELFPINFALAVSNATLKVGDNQAYHSKHLDFMIDLKGKKEIHSLFSQINHFLSMFKNR